MLFDEYLIPYEWNIGWIEGKLEEMIALINQNKIPNSNQSCKNCAYAEQYSNKIFNF